MSGRMERITWVDSGLSYASTWLEETEIITRAKEWTGECTAVGQVIYEDDERVVLGLIHDPENKSWASCFLIAKTSVIKRATLEVPTGIF